MLYMCSGQFWLDGTIYNDFYVHGLDFMGAPIQIELLFLDALEGHTYLLFKNWGGGGTGGHS